MSNVVVMSDAKSVERGPNSNVEAVGSDLHANFTYRLFIIVDTSTFTLIDHLRVSLEAHSYGDVIRQAVRLFAIRFSKENLNAISEYRMAELASIPTKLKRLNLRIPVKTKERLDFLKGRTNLSYTEIIISGLYLLSARAKEEEAFLNSLEGEMGENGEIDSKLKMEVPINSKVLASG